MQKSMKQKYIDTKLANSIQVSNKLKKYKLLVYFSIALTISFLLNVILYYCNNNKVSSLHALLGFHVPIAVEMTLVLIICLHDWLKRCVINIYLIFFTNNKNNVSLFMESTLKWLVALLFFILSILLGHGAFVIGFFYPSYVPWLVAALIVLYFIRIYFE